MDSIEPPPIEIENKPELIKETEDFFFVCQNNMTQDAKNTVWGFLNLAKKSYSESPHKPEWNMLLKNLQTIINDFHNDYSTKSELKLAAMHRNAQQLQEKETRHVSKQNKNEAAKKEELRPETTPKNLT